MTHAAKRRWFRFSLRTLFVVVTVFGVWLGWEIKYVRDRRRFWIEWSRRCVASCTSITLTLFSRQFPYGDVGSAIVLNVKSCCQLALREPM